MTSIAPIRVDDFDDWLGLFTGYLEFYRTELDQATIEATFARIANPYFSINGALARDDAGRAVGLVHWLTHPATWTQTDYCYLEDLYVAADGRGAGVGSALIEHVRTWAAEHGSSKVYWLTDENNRTARSVYDKLAQRSGMIQYQIHLAAD